MAITTGKFSVYPVAYALFGHSGDPPGVARDVRQSPHRFPVDANTLDRAFTVEAPNRVWAGDLTYVWTLEGLLYLAVLLALYSRRVVGWAMGQRLRVSYQHRLAEYGLTPSMSRKGNCWDKACVESFGGRLKHELVHQRQYATRDDAKQDIFEYIEVFYNRQRQYSTLGYHAPVEFEARAAVA